MQQWEYARTEYLISGNLGAHRDDGMAAIAEGTTIEFLTRAGREGWEMCGTLPIGMNGDKVGVIFKRLLS